VILEKYKLYWKKNGCTGREELYLIFWKIVKRRLFLRSLLTLLTYARQLKNIFKIMDVVVKEVGGRECHPNCNK